MGELVDDVEHPVFLSLVGAILDKVVRPDMARVFRPQPDARTISKPEPALLRLLCRNLEPLAPPEAFDPLVVHHPAGGRAQKLRDLAIAIAAISSDQHGDVVDQRLFVFWPRGTAALRRAMLPEHAAHPPLGQLHL